MIRECLTTSKHVNNPRTVEDVTVKLMEEVGEVAAEISKLKLSANKTTESESEIKSNTINELANVYNCIIDLAYITHKDELTIEEIESKLSISILTKLKKWRNNYNK